jgi:hypothetical protein
METVQEGRIGRMPASVSNFPVSFAEVLPVSCTNVASVIRRYTTAVGNYAQDDESSTRDDLQETQSKLDLNKSVNDSAYSYPWLTSP